MICVTIVTIGSHALLVQCKFESRRTLDSCFCIHEYIYLASSSPGNEIYDGVSLWIGVSSTPSSFCECRTFSEEGKKLSLALSSASHSFIFSSLARAGKPKPEFAPCLRSLLCECVPWVR